jgi:aminodeoxyfutalosine deaminase
MTLDPAIEAFILGLPKADLHIHLEGSVRPATLRALAAQYGEVVPAAEGTGFRDFDAFVATYVAICRCLRTRADFARVATELGEEAARQTVRYLEVTVTASRHVGPDLTIDDLLDGLVDGADAAAARHGVVMRYVFDCPRDAGVPAMERTVDWAIGGHRRGVVAVGLSGREDQLPSRPFLAAVERARRAGLAFVPHAGELAGAEVVRDVIEMGADRIGHGIRAIEDPAVLLMLRERAIPLEVCITSNLCTGAVRSLAEHPLLRLWQAGIQLTLASDDPPLFGTDLVGEYRAAARLGFDRAMLERVARRGFEAASVQISW